MILSRHNTKIVGKLKKNKGQSLVEMAFILPIILLVVMGIVEFGRIFNTYLVLTNASREGARVASVGGTDTDVMNSILNVTPTLDPMSLSITIDPLEANRSRGLPATVTTNYNIELICPIVNVILPNPFPLTSQTVMRIE